MTSRKKYFFIHSIEYFFLAGVVLTSLISLFLLTDFTVKTLLVFVLTSVYLIWGLIHHWLEHDLKLSTILEYAAMALLVLWVLLSVAS